MAVLVSVGGVALPTPSTYVGNTATIVDSARNVEGYAIGTVIRHNVDLNEIILCAAQDRELDGHGDLTDIHLHTILRELYRTHAAGLITKEDAAKHKALYIKAYQSDKSTMEQYRKATADWNEKIKTAEKTGIQLHKAESLRDFAKDAAKMIELLTGDVGLVKMAEKLPEVGF